jgi:hypothetical protein
VTQQYPPGSTVPLQPWLLADIQQSLTSNHAATRRVAAGEQYLAQRYGAWRVFPVKVGRWVRVSYLDADEWGGTGASWLLAPVLLPWRPGKWRPELRYIQLLDPATGQPIAEHTLRGVPEDQQKPLRSLSTIALLGDPRVGGLFCAPESAVSRQQVWDGHRRGRQLSSDPVQLQQIEQRLIGEPYRDFTERDDGPWLADQPERPQGNTNQWKPSRWQQV